MGKGLRRILLFSLLWISIALTSCTLNFNEIKQRSDQVEGPSTSPLPIDNSATSQGKKVMNIPVSRAIAAKMIALTFNDPGDIVALDREIKFDDTDPSKWYDIYINAAVIQGFMNGTDQKFFSPLDPLSMEQASFLLQRINPEEPTTFIPLTEENRKEPISYDQWVEAYLSCLEKGKKDQTLQQAYGLVTRSLVIIGTPANTPELPPWSMGTDQGIYGFSGLVMDSYMDQKVRLLVRGTEIVAFLDLIEENPTLNHVYVQEMTHEAITIFLGGIKRSYPYDGNNITHIGEIADLTLQKGVITDAESFSTEFRDRILRVGTTDMELENHKLVEFWDDVKIYSTIGDKLTWKGKSALIVGTNIARFVVKDDKICAAIIDQSASLSNIRVALHTTDFNGLLHKEVKISGAEGFIVQHGQEETAFESGEVFVINSQTVWDTEKDPRIYIRPKTSEGMLEIQNIVRGWGENRKSPSYRGILEISKSEGGYTIINEVNIEEYLYSVVPSEMPASHGVEAAKVQAVTARSYAHAQMYSNRYHAYGGHVDDSTSCQVYNNTPENPISIQAVTETKGQGITFKGDVVSANFFSTSSGYTANAGEVWPNYQTQAFPGSTPPYLVSKKQYEEGNYGDMSQEENAYRFLKTKTINGYDQSFRWFRWEVTMTQDELSASINANLEQRYSAKPKLVKTLDENNIFRIRPVQHIGELQDIQIYKRGQGGNIMEMILIGTEKTVKIATEYNIRYILRPMQYLSGKNPIILTQADNTEVVNFSAMPSAFFVMDKKKDSAGKLESITFYGGGYGHGVGMSQNGVKGMVDKGYDYKQILQHYYPGTHVTSIFN
ncbi:MAG: SpoIID/LytB domain-containing protein [Epulopiscium sp.]|nr:SpoIID/LytB domain-containing protein [Candidatus Epulonipiscium sp.]